MNDFTCIHGSVGKKVILAEENGDLMELKVRDVAIEQHPFSLPSVKLTCTYEREDLFKPVSEDVKKKAARTNVPRHMRKKSVVFNPPATIVLWEDGTKTVVKCDERDEFDPKYGLALCYMKKALGNTSRNLNDVLHEEAKNHE